MISDCHFSSGLVAHPILTGSLYFTFLSAIRSCFFSVVERWWRQICNILVNHCICELTEPKLWMGLLVSNNYLFLIPYSIRIESSILFAVRIQVPVIPSTCDPKYSKYPCDWEGSGWFCRYDSRSYLLEYVCHLFTTLKKHDLIAERKVKHRDPVRIGWATKPDEKWQSDIMYIRIHGRFFYLSAFKDEYSRYIVHPFFLDPWMRNQWAWKRR